MKNPLPLFSIISLLIADLSCAKVYVLPESGRIPYVEKIKSAEKTIDITAYAIDDPMIIAELVKKAEEGVKIRMILEKDKFMHDSSKSKNEDLREIHKNIIVKKTPKTVSQMHMKLFVIDKKDALISTGNLDRESFEGLIDEAPTRDFILTIQDCKILSILNNIFNADWTETELKESDLGDLLVSPINYREKLRYLLESANKSIEIYQQDITDEEMKYLLLKRIEDGIDVSVIMTPHPFSKKTDNNKDIQDGIKDKGGQVVLTRFPYIHTKLIIIDKNTSDEKAILGSSNLYTPSLDKNREIGIIIRDKNDLHILKQTFMYDLNVSVKK